MGAVHGHPLCSRRDVETAGVILAERLQGSDVLLARRLLPVPDDGYQIRRVDHVRIDPVAINRLVRHARDTGLSVITVHTHPGTNQPWFSSADDEGDSRLMPSLFAQMPGPHGSVVIAGDTRTPVARCWSEAGMLTDITVSVVGQALQMFPAHPPHADDKWFPRQTLALGEAGQAVLRQLHVGVVGLGGTGSVALVQLAHLGVGRITAVDGDRVEASNVSRVLGATRHDVGVTWKVGVADRYIRQLGFGTDVTTLRGHLGAEVSPGQLEAVDVLLSCVDRHSPRALLNRLSYARAIPLIDMGSAFRVDHRGHIVAGVGRVVVVGPGRRCLACWGHIDPERLRMESLSQADRASEESEGYIAGADVPQPSVVSFNTIVAGAAMIELLRVATGFAGTADPPARLSFDFESGTVRRNRLGATHACSICTPHREAGASTTDPATDQQ